MAKHAETFEQTFKGVFVSHISGSRSPDSPYGLDTLLIRILYLLILLAQWIRARSKMAQTKITRRKPLQNSLNHHE